MYDSTSEDEDVGSAMPAATIGNLLFGSAFMDDNDDFMFDETEPGEDKMGDEDEEEA
jgi:hypothetical protein